MKSNEGNKYFIYFLRLQGKEKHDTVQILP